MIYKFLKFFENNSIGSQNLPLVILSYNENEHHYQLLKYNRCNINNKNIKNNNNQYKKSNNISIIFICKYIVPNLQ